MRILVLSATILLANIYPSSAQSDYSGIPSAIRIEIKANCVRQYPTDYVMQHGCIMLQSESYLKVHGPRREIDVTGIPSAHDRAQINNSAYLTVAKSVCGVDVGTMPARYRDRAAASDRLNAEHVRDMIAGTIERFQSEAKADKIGFCAQAKTNLPNFVADLER